MHHRAVKLCVLALVIQRAAEPTATEFPWNRLTATLAPFKFVQRHQRYTCCSWQGRQTTRPSGRRQEAQSLQSTSDFDAAASHLSIIVRQSPEPAITNDDASPSRTSRTRSTAIRRMASSVR
jgi:hypothetical protein